MIRCGTNLDVAVIVVTLVVRVVRRDEKVLSLVDAVQAFKKDRDVTKNSAEHR